MARDDGTPYVLSAHVRVRVCLRWCALSEVCEVSLRLRALRVWGMRACCEGVCIERVLGGDAGAEE